MEFSTNTYGNYGFCLHVWFVALQSHLGEGDSMHIPEKISGLGHVENTTHNKPDVLPHLTHDVIVDDGIGGIWVYEIL